VVRKGGEVRAAEALQSDHAGLGGDVADPYVEALRLGSHPGEILGCVGGVHHHEPAIREPVDEDVVDDAARFHAEHGVVRAAGGETRRRAHPQVLLSQPGCVQHGHIPAAELEHPGACPYVPLVELGLPHRSLRRNEKRENEPTLVLPLS
jgi:hypothetical protein